MASLSKNLNKKPKQESANPSLKNALNPVEADDGLEEEDPVDTEEESDSSATDTGGVEALDKNERDRAYSLFEKAKSRNEWMELAQLLGKAATQYAAAQSGMQTGRAVGPLQIPEIDYGKKTEGEERMLERRLRDIRETESGMAKAIAAKEAKEQREKKFGLEERRTAAAEKRAAQVPMDPVQKAEEIAQSKSKLEKSQALDALISTQGQLLSKELTPAQKAQAEKSLLIFANQAGVDIDEVYRQATVPGTLWGQKVDQQKVLDILRSKKAAPAAAAQPAATPAPAAAAPAKTTALPPTKVRVKYQGKVLEIPQENLQEALKDGAELVK